MAEASITINDVVFVVDCGKAKETTYDALNNTPCLLPSWISQASARQVSLISLLTFSYSLDSFVCDENSSALLLHNLIHVVVLNMSAEHLYIFLAA